MSTWFAGGVADSLPKSRETLAFAVVGSIGFGIDASVLAIMFHGFGWGHYTARLVSFVLAVTATWYLNRNWTFAHRARDDRRREYAIYFIIQLVGGALNFAVYALCLALSPTMHAHPTLALAVGSVVAMCFNFFASRHWAFTGAAD